MEGITRRRLLERVATGGLILVLDPDAWAQGPCPAPVPSVTTYTAMRRARQLGRPLLVIIKPARAAPVDLREREQLWRDFFTLASDEGLVDLGLCVVLSAMADDARGALEREDYPTLEGEPLALLVETDRAETRLFDPELPPFVLGDAPRVRGRWRKLLRARVAVVEHALRRLVVPSRVALGRRAQQVRATGARYPHDGRRLERDFVLRRLAAEEAGAARDERIAELATEVPESLAAALAPPPPPPRPAIACGGGPCGTGHVPAASRRFLDYWVQE